MAALQLTVQTCQSEVIHAREGCASTVLQQALESAGIEFIDENGDGPGAAQAMTGLKPKP